MHRINYAYTLTYSALFIASVVSIYKCSCRSSALSYYSIVVCIHVVYSWFCAAYTTMYVQHISDKLLEWLRQSLLEMPYIAEIAHPEGSVSAQLLFPRATILLLLETHVCLLLYLSVYCQTCTVFLYFLTMDTAPCHPPYLAAIATTTNVAVIMLHPASVSACLDLLKIWNFVASSARSWHARLTRLP